jgi:hypothetical protein
MIWIAPYFFKIKKNKMKIRFIILITGIIFSGSLFAQYVNIDEAYEYAKKHISSTSSKHIVNEVPINIQNENQDRIHVFSLSPLGYCIVAAEKKAYPLVGYSFESNFPASTNKNFHSFLSTVVEQIEDTRQSPVSEHQAWYSENKSTTEYIDPLLDNLWNQDSPYNYSCPADDAGPGGHVYAGCVATAQSMIMHYWQWPYTGEGEDSYYCVGYGTISADFSTGNYDPRGMISSADNKLCRPIADLMFHCGVANHMGYGVDESGTGSNRVSPSFKDFFKYDEDAILIYKDIVGIDVFSEMVADNLSLGRPVWLAGISGSGGHAFVVDGMDEYNNFHFNFGWSGYGNGFFSMLNAGGYNAGLQAVMGIYPDADKGYPHYQDGLEVVSYIQGSLFDGSGPIENYIPDLNTQWLIDPQQEGDLVESISIDWKEFDLASGDYVRVYDGSDVTAPLLGEYTGNQLPSNISSSGNTLLVEFVSDENEEAAGFRLEYFATTVNHCYDITQLTEPTGSFDDGSGEYNYGNGSFCIWQIVPDTDEPLVINFESFDIEEGAEQLKIFDYTNNQLLAAITGSYNENNLPDPVIVESGKANVRFTSNAFQNGPGWEISYGNNILGVDSKKHEDVKDIVIFPCPANEYVNIQIGGQFKFPVQLNLIDLTGKILESKIINENVLELFIGDLPNGVYILQVNSSNYSSNTKLIKN